MTEMMKAYVIRGPGHLNLVDQPIPNIDAESVLLKTMRVSICETDVSYYAGRLTPPQWPIIPGHEYLGEVVEKRTKNNSIKIGDRVVYWSQTDFGGLAEYKAIRPVIPGSRAEKHWFTERGFMDDKHAAAIVLDDDVFNDEATLLEPITAVLRALLYNPPSPGDDAIILGAGFCGLIALQLLKWQGVSSVAVIDKNPERLALALRSGADASYNIETDILDLEKLADDRNGNYAQYLFDSLPDISKEDDSADPRSMGMKLLAPGGLYILYGAKEAPQKFDTRLMVSKGLRVRSTPFDVRVFPMWKTASVLKLAQRILSKGMISLSPLITHYAEFQDFAAVKTAFDDHGKADRMKTLINLDSVQTPN